MLKGFFMLVHVLKFSFKFDIFVHHGATLIWRVEGSVWCVQ